MSRLLTLFLLTSVLFSYGQQNLIPLGLHDSDRIVDIFAGTDLNKVVIHENDTFFFEEDKWAVFRTRTEINGLNGQTPHFKRTHSHIKGVITYDIYISDIEPVLVQKYKDYEKRFNFYFVRQDSIHD